VRAPAKRRRILVFALLAKVRELGEEDEGEVEGGGETVAGGEAVAAGFPVAKGSIAEAVGRALEAVGRAMERGLEAGMEGWRRLAEEDRA
jgi:hypothetical protein